LLGRKGALSAVAETPPRLFYALWIVAGAPRLLEWRRTAPRVPLAERFRSD